MKKILALLIAACTALTIAATTPEKETTECCSTAKSTTQTYNASIGGEWIITECNGKKISTEAENIPFILFNLSDSIVYGNNSCNIINGRFTTTNDQQIKIENLITTMMACQDAHLESDIMQSLSKSVKYTITDTTGCEQLHLLNEKNSTVLKLKRHNIAFLNGTWRVTAINDSEVELNDAMLVIDINEKTLHGNTGCNIVNGEIEIDLTKDNSIQFSKLISTRIYCPNMQFETELLLALENAETVAVGKTSNQAIFYNAAAEPILTLTRELVCH